MKQHAIRLLSLTLCVLCGASLAAEKPKKAREDVTAGKPYTYKTSAGKERQMEIYFPSDPSATPKKKKEKISE